MDKIDTLIVKQCETVKQRLKDIYTKRMKTLADLLATDIKQFTTLLNTHTTKNEDVKKAIKEATDDLQWLSLKDIVDDIY